MQRNRGKQQNGKNQRSLPKKLDTKGIFHAKIGTIKDRNSTDLTEAEGIQKRWHERTEELYKNGHKDQDRDDVCVTHVKPDILEYEVKWALGSITTNNDRAGDGIPAELFKNPKG